MRVITVVPFALLVVGLASVSQAAVAPRSAVIDQHISRECILLKARYIHAAESGFMAKIPSLNLTNNCSDDITIQSVLTSKAPDEAKKSASRIKMYLKTSIEDSANFVFSDDGEDCENLSSDGSIHADGPHCKSILVPVGNTLMLPMAWDTYFKISGWMGRPKDQVSASSAVIIEGKMIQNESPN